ncbi:MAG TPA: hypothetical protein VFP66_00615 [Candidatus Limnocylindrales bacterium]|nr:hypothetical protein [Candidatus Limnocylindrales bacterium]
MSEPIFFISHFRIKNDKFDPLKRLAIDTAERLRTEKPRTVLFLSYVDEDRGVISFLHAFADAEAMDIHFAGSEERARAALEFVQPIGWEFYGRPSGAALDYDAPDGRRIRRDAGRASRVRDRLPAPRVSPTWRGCRPPSVS